MLAYVTGVILNPGLVFGKAVLMPSAMHFDLLSKVWILLSFIALQFGKVNMVLWIRVSLGIGIITFILQGL